MNLQLFREYRIQSVFALLASVLIMGGSLMTGVIMKARGFPDVNELWHPLALFVRNWGFLFIGFPIIWVIISISLENNPEVDFTKKWTIISGFVLLGFLACLMFVTVILASGGGNLIKIDSEIGVLP